MTKTATPSFAGRTYMFRVDNGMVLRASFGPGGRKLSWEAVEGPNAGTGETVDMQVAEISDNVYFVNWLESNGMTVSRVMDMNSGMVHVFWTMPDQSGIGGRTAETHTGTMSPA